MLTWGAFNIVGASSKQRAEIERLQREVAAAVDAEITDLGIEDCTPGATALRLTSIAWETLYPKTGWMVPMAPSWIVSTTHKAVARLVPDPARKRYAIEIRSGVSDAEMEQAQQGTVIGGRLVHPINLERSGVEITTIRGDYRDETGAISQSTRPGDVHIRPVAGQGYP